MKIFLIFLICFVAIAGLSIRPGADAHYIRFYYDDLNCGGSSSSLWFLGASTSCQTPWNSTQTKTNTGSFILSKCNATTGLFSFNAYSQLSCFGVEFQSYTDAAADTCKIVGLGSMRVVCSDDVPTTFTTTTVPSSTTASPLPPAPGSHCAPLLLPNGSTVSFSNSASLSGDFKQMFQANAGSLHDWSFSLCYPNQQSSSAPPCATGTYMAESSTCKLKIPDPANISLSSDGNAIIFTFPGALQTDGDTWHPTITCVCNRSATTSLYSKFNGYWTMWQNGQVTALWTLSSAGCCYDLPTTSTAPTTSTYPVPTPAPITTTIPAPITGNQCKKVTFANGSYVPFTNYKKLTGFFPSIQQYGINPHMTSWSLSLCDPSIVAPSGNGQVCNPHSYLSENGCETIFPQLSFQTRDQNLEVGFTYIRRINATLSHYAYIYCACDPTAQNELKVPSNSYNVFSDPTGDLIEMWRVSSVECCAVNPNRSTTTSTSTTSMLPPNTSSTTITTWVTPNNTVSTTIVTTTPAPGGSNNNNNSPGGDNNGNGTTDVKVFGFAAAGAAAGVIIVGCAFFFVRWICTRKTNSNVDAYRSAYEHPLNEHTP